MRKSRLIGIALVLATGAAIWKHEAIVDKVLDLRYGQTLPAPRFPAPANGADARLQDLDYLAQLPHVDRSFSADGTRAFAEHVAALKARAASLTDAQFFLGVAEAAAPWRRIILDLRFDAGGDYPVVYRALEALPRRLAPDGKLAILVDNTTFSAAIIAAALVKHFAAGRATIVGEKPGDRLSFWAEGGAIELPNSKIKVNISTGFHDWAHGCRELRCWWPNFFYDVAAGSVDPDVVVTWRFEDYRRGVDTVLARARQ